MGYIQYQVIYNYRVKLDDAGKIIGNPEMTKPSFIRPIKDTDKAKKVTPNLDVDTTGETQL
jgi:hypothetical protein